MAKSAPSTGSLRTILENDSPDSNDYENNKPNKTDNDDDHHHVVNDKSPTTSLRSLSISIITMDNAGESIVDSDSETELDVDNVEGKYVLHKLGEQTSYAPNSAELHNMNKDLKLISQHITPNGNLVSNNDLSEIEKNNITPIAGSSKIGSIVLSNSTNVQFGDKHFYEGPVTIVQQYLIGNRERRKEEHHAYDNPEFKSEETTRNSDAVPQVNLQEKNVKSVWSYHGIRLKEFTIITTGIMIAVITITSIFLYAITHEKFKLEDKQFVNKIKDKTFITTQNGKLRLIRREDWSARSPKNKLGILQLPVHRAIIQHTDTPPCQTDIQCVFRVQNIQNQHMNVNGWSDIGYNFLIGSEGQVIVGRDWRTEGAHTYPYNRDSVGIAVIGSFILMSPSSEQVKALDLLLEWGVMEKNLAPNYRLYGARQLQTTESPGLILYNILKNFTHWSEEI